MKIIVLKENFKQSFLSVERAIGNGTILPILKNVLIKTEQGRIKVAATDLEIGITSWLNGKIIEEGGITVPAGILGAILNNINSSKLELEVVDSKLKIKTEKSENIIQGIKESDFPIIPKIKTSSFIELKTPDFKKALNQVISAASFNERRPEINGILFWLKDKKIKMAATDTFRLAEKTIKETEFKTEIDEIKVIIPLKTVQEVVRIVEEDKKIKIFIDPHQILFNLENIELISRLIEGVFPEYDSLLPKENQTSVLIDKEDLFNAVKLAAVFVSKVNDIKVKTSAPNKFEVFAQESTIGENKSDLDAEINGENQELVLNWHYLLDGLKGIESDIVFLGMNGEIKPVVLHSPKDENYLYILMPIKNNY